MKCRVAINGFGRIGRLALRAAWRNSDFDVVHINEIAGDVETAAHLLKFDSVHGIWDLDISGQFVGANQSLVIDGKTISYSQNRAIEATPWTGLGVDIVIDCTGKFKTEEALNVYLEQGIKKVVVSAPVKEGALNIVMGVNDSLYDPGVHDIVTAASCTTNCLAPVVDVIHREFGIRHGSITTIHDITNTQSILDEFHPDLRRARACGQSLIPTTTGSAKAITVIFPELEGRLNGLAVRVPVVNSSLTDCVFELEKPVTVDVVNGMLEQAANGYLAGVMGYEERPLVSVDYVNDTRSGIIDALSTMVINGTQLKLFVWYDNETGYVHRLTELAAKVAKAL